MIQVTTCTYSQWLRPQHLGTLKQQGKGWGHQYSLKPSWDLCHASPKWKMESLLKSSALDITTLLLYIIGQQLKYKINCVLVRKQKLRRDHIPDKSHNCTRHRYGPMCRVLHRSRRLHIFRHISRINDLKSNIINTNSFYTFLV